MLDLILSIIASALISIVMRLSEGGSDLHCSICSIWRKLISQIGNDRNNPASPANPTRKKDRPRSRLFMISMNYAACVVMSLLYGARAYDVPDNVVMLGLVSGVFFLSGLMMMQVNIAHNGVVAASVFSRLGGLIVPVAVSVLLFSEMPTTAQAVGAALASVSIIAISRKSDGVKDTGTLHSGGASAFGLLAALFAAEGMASLMSRVFSRVCDAADGNSYLMFTFLSAFLCGAVLIVLKRERIGAADAVFGTAIGILNFMSLRFMLNALEVLPSIVVYPMRGVCVILLASLAGVMIFGERLSRIQTAAMAMILFSVALLTAN